MLESQTLVVGDIQGCYSGLMDLLEKANFDEKKDRLFAVGDLVARGDDSLATLKYLMDLGDNFQSVLGNHDLHFLAVSQGIKSAKKNDRLNNLLKYKRLGEVVDWLRRFPLALSIDDTCTLVHAGLYPDWSPAMMLALSREVSDILKGPNWKNLISDMYGNGPETWKVSLTGKQRYRFIINACTRMRFLETGNRLEFATKSNPKDAKTCLIPWFRVENPHISPQQRILFGHWAALEGQTQSSQFLALDTGYVWGNTMTALRLEDNTLITVSA